MKKAAILFLTIVLQVSLSLAVSVSKTSAAMAEGSAIVVLDAGHGGVDNGVVGVKTGVKEAEINLQVVIKLKEFFEGAGYTVVLTRSNAAGLYGPLPTKGFKLRDLNERVRITNESGAVMFISVHMNKFSSRDRRGAQVFFKIDNEDSDLLAECVQCALNAMPECARKCERLAGDYYVLNGANCPAVIVEGGFLSNAEDEKLLLTDQYREKLAHAIFCGATEFISRKFFAETVKRK